MLDNIIVQYTYAHIVYTSIIHCSFLDSRDTNIIYGA